MHLCLKGPPKNFWEQKHVDSTEAKIHRKEESHLTSCVVKATLRDKTTITKFIQALIHLSQHHVYLKQQGLASYFANSGQWPLSSCP